MAGLGKAVFLGPVELLGLERVTSHPSSAAMSKQQTDQTVCADREGSSTSAH